jgi:hypothetical protein
MRKLFPWILVGFLCGCACGTVIKKVFYTNSTRVEIEEDASAFTQEEIDLAKHLFVEFWTNRFDMSPDLEPAIENSKVTITTKTFMAKAGFGIGGDLFEDSLCAGLTLPNGDVIVWRGFETTSKEKPYKLYKTALVHEFAHVANKVMYDTFDPDHEGSEYKGWTKEHTLAIEELRYIFMQLDL